MGEKTPDTVHRFSPLGEEPRQLIAIWLDVEVLRWPKSLAAKRRVPYQSLINELLAGEMRKAE